MWTIELTQKQVNTILIVGSIIIFGLGCFALSYGNISNLSTIGY